MSEEGKFWLGVAICFVLFVGIITGATTYYYMKQMQHIKDMVMSGTDPIEARCALYDSYSYEGSALICMEVAKK